MKKTFFEIEVMFSLMFVLHGKNVHNYTDEYQVPSALSKQKITNLVFQSSVHCIWFKEKLTEIHICVLINQLLHNTKIVFEHCYLI